MSAPRIDIRAVAAAAQGRAASLLSQWFPAGVLEAGEFCVGSLAGEKGRSLKINVKSGKWKDFSAGDGGRDLVDLFAALHGIENMAEAARDLAAELGLDEQLASGGRVRGTRFEAERAPATDAPAVWPITPVPDEAPGIVPGERTPPLYNPKRGKATTLRPSMVFPYRGAAGELLGYVVRQDFGNGKITPMLSWCRLPEGGEGWAYCSFASPRPLFGLQELAARPADKVLVVEGEKAAVAGRRELGDDYAVVTWAGGSNGVRYADWSPLAGREVTIWPDADWQTWPADTARAGQVKPLSEQPGWKAAQAAAAMARDAGAASVSIVTPDPAWEDGADLHDFMTLGWSREAYERCLRDAEPSAGPPATEEEEPPPAAPPPAGPDDVSPRDPLEDCPFTPLGATAGGVVVVSSLGLVMELPFRGLKLETLEALTMGEMRWWYRHFGEEKDDGTKTLKVTAARRWLLQACRDCGVFDARMPVRGPGVWPDPAEPGKVVVHAGDGVRVDGEWLKPGFRRGGVIFTGAPKAERPAEAPAAASWALALEDLVRCWTFENDAAARLVVGFAGQAMLGAWHRWRSHLFMRAQYGSGKSWLAKVVEAALGGATHPIENNFTAAYLHQALTGEARAMILDEAERDDTAGHRIDTVIELIRNMSGADGARIGRGSAGGVARGYSITGAVYMSSILQGYLKPQDRSRITTIELGRLDDAAKAPGRDEEIAARIRKLAKASPALRARMIDGADRFLENFRTWRAGFIAHGSDTREADQLATLVAGYETLVSDHPSHPDYVDEHIADYAEWIGASAEDETEGEGRECWNHLLGSPVDLWRSGERKTVARLLLEACEPSGVDLRRSIQSIGLRVENWNDPAARHVLVANRSVGLARLFNETRWDKGAWPDGLRYLEGAAAHSAVRFDGVLQRCTQVPARHLPVDEFAGHRNAGPSEEDIAAGEKALEPGA